AWMAVEGAVGLGMAGQGATLILHTSWFNCSSWIRVKKITAIRVYGCLAFTSRISSFRPSIKPSCPICAVAVAAAAPTQATAAFAHWQLHYQGMATLVISATALVGDRVGHGRQPLAGVLQSAPLASTALKMVVPAGDASAHRRRPCRLLPPLAGVAGLPCGLALAAFGRHLAGGLSHGLAVDGWPCMGAGRGWPPLLLAAFAAKIQQERVERFYTIQYHHTKFKTNFCMKTLALIPLLGNLNEEIVYPYIPDPDGEDEGGQASSSLAVSTRSISVVKVLQSDLATLTQWEGGE
ncbi:hypothetical protein B296_00054399, partial [Ensete ventricosum]